MGSKPNVLVFFTDQQRYNTINRAGYPYMITPNLDRLAADGCVYLNAHTTNPVCMAARHDLLTGLPGRAHGIFNNCKQPIKDYSLPTLPRIFSENGYRTAAVGKMHFYPARMHHGYNELFLMEELPECRQDDQYASFLEEEGQGDIQNLHGVRPHIYHLPQTSQMDDKHHGTAWVAERTIQWLKQNKHKPFFLFASWIHPHPPFALPKPFQGLYKDKVIPEPAPVSRDYPYEGQTSEWYGDTDSDQDRRSIREAYYSCITHVDHHIGKVLDYLEETKQIDNTLIIFTADHGEMLQDKGFYQKMLPYEGSVRVPFIVRYPIKFAKGSVREQFVDLLDIFPTCLDICGLQYNGEKYKLLGESLCTENPRKNRNYQICSHGFAMERWVMCRNNRYKYIYRYNCGTEELYDMVHDPQETVNLRKEGTYPREVFEELKRAAILYEKDWGPEGFILDNRFIILEGRAYHSNSNSKFSFWMNNQTQYFDERSHKARGEAFMKEITWALSGSEKAITEVFNHPEWKKSFMDNWHKFGRGTDIEKKLFD